MSHRFSGSFSFRRALIPSLALAASLLTPAAAMAETAAKFWNRLGDLTLASGGTSTIRNVTVTLPFDAQLVVITDVQLKTYDCTGGTGNQCGASPLYRGPMSATLRVRDAAGTSRASDYKGAITKLAGGTSGIPQWIYSDSAMMLQVVTGVLPAGTYNLTLEVKATGAYAIKYAPGAMSALIVPEI